MSSTFKELYDDFREGVKSYTAELDITKQGWMRLYTQAMRDFQKQTELIDKYVRIPIDTTDNVFYQPNDTIRILRVTDMDGLSLISNSFEQFVRNREVITNERYDYQRDNYTRRVIGTYRIEKARLFTVYNRTILIHPTTREDGTTDTEIDVWYIPDLEPYSSNSSQWTEWFPYDTNFDTYFNTSSVNPILSRFEDVFNTLTKADFLESRGAKEIADGFRKAYQISVEKAYLNKPRYFTEGTVDYRFAPFS